MSSASRPRKGKPSPRSNPLKEAAPKRTGKSETAPGTYDRHARKTNTAGGDR